MHVQISLARNCGSGHERVRCHHRSAPGIMASPRRHLAPKGWWVAVFEKNATRRRGEDPRSHTSRLPARSLRDESQSLRRLALPPGLCEDLMRMGSASCRPSIALRPPFRTVAGSASARISRRPSSRSKHSRARMPRPGARLVATFPARRAAYFRPARHSDAVRATAGVGWNALARQGLPLAARDGKAVGVLAARVARRTFRSDHVKATLAAWGMHLDFSPDIAGGALFPYLESLANQSFGMVIGEGGADTMIKAMSAVSRARRQDLHRSEVARDHDAGGRAPACDSPIGRDAHGSARR